jgi:amino acid permease
MEVKQVFNFYLQVTVLVILTLKQLCQFYSKIVTGQHSKKDLHDKYVVVPADKTTKISFCVYIILHLLKRNSQLPWQPYIYPDDIYERRNHGKS